MADRRDRSRRSRLWRRDETPPSTPEGSHAGDLEPEEGLSIDDVKPGESEQPQKHDRGGRRRGGPARKPAGPVGPVGITPDARGDWDIPLDAVDLTWDSKDEGAVSPEKPADTEKQAREVPYPGSETGPDASEVEPEGAVTLDAADAFAAAGGMEPEPPLFDPTVWEELEAQDQPPTRPLPIFEEATPTFAAVQEPSPAGTAPMAAAAGAVDEAPVPDQDETGVLPVAGVAAGEGARETLEDFRVAPSAPPMRTTSIADLARAHEEATVEQEIAQDLDRRADRRKIVVTTLVLALLGVGLGSGAALWAVSRQQRTGGVAPKIGLSAGAGGGVAIVPTTTPDTSPAAAEVTTPTGAQVAVVILGLGDGSNEASSNLGKFSVQRLPLTYAIYPQRSGTSKDAAVVQASGGQGVLYQPVGGANSSAKDQRGGIEVAMSNRQIANMLIRNGSGISSNAGIAPLGFSRGALPAKALRILAVVGLRQNVFLFDSTDATGLPMSSAAAKLGVKYLRPDVVLDKRNNEKAFRAQWDMALGIADRDRRVVVVCTLSGLSARALPPLLAAIDTNKYSLTLASTMAR